MKFRGYIRITLSLCLSAIMSCPYLSCGGTLESINTSHKDCL